MKTGNDKNTLRVSSRKDWRDWLQSNFGKEQEIWLIFPRKTAKETGISYNDAIEEALCFGWIDSVHKTLDTDHTILRFTPRKPKSGFSQVNKERLRLMMKQKQIHPSLLGPVQEILKEAFIFPDDIMRVIKADKAAWANFQGFSESYKRIRIASIESLRKQPAEFEKRLTNFIDKTRQNKLISGGPGGIEKYY